MSKELAAREGFITRILILSANTGEGHNSAAQAMKQHFEGRGWACDIRDGLSYLPPLNNYFICRGHVFFYRRFPRLYGMGYRHEERRSRRIPYQQELIAQSGRSRPLPRRLTALKELINGYDAVICAHVFVARQVSKLRIRSEIHIPCFFLATDYTCSPGVNQLDMDGWLIPHRRLVSEFTAHGIPKEKIFPTGIPIRSEFMHRKAQDAIRAELKLPENRPIALLSCGSMGAGHMGRMVLALVEALPRDALLVVICGSNQKLQKRLKRLIHSKRLLVLGFTRRMHDYMDAADLFLTKPGGLSTTEAAAKRLPMVLINAVPGVETRNMEFMKAAGCAVSVGGFISLARTVSLILKSGDSLENLRAGCEREFCTDAAEEIAQILTTRCGE